MQSKIFNSNKHLFIYLFNHWNTNQDVEAVGAEDADEYSSDSAQGQAGVTEGVRHGEDASAETSLEQMYQGLSVPALWQTYNQILSIKIRVNTSVKDGSRFLALYKRKRAYR